MGKKRDKSPNGNVNLNTSAGERESDWNMVMSMTTHRCRQDLLVMIAFFVLVKRVTVGRDREAKNKKQ
jgi:hypothetical protein